MIFKLPHNIKSDIAGYTVFACIVQESRELDAVTLDFSEVCWVDANMLAILGYLRENNKLKFVNLPHRHERLFNKNGFLLGYPSFPDDYDSTVKYKKFQKEQTKEFEKYLDSDLLSKDDFPKTSFMLKKKIKESCIEIFENAVIHGNAELVFTCGQYYRGVGDKRLDFTIVDVGKTIKINVANFLNKVVSAKDAINWAVQKGNTTKSKNIPGGLGLSLIREFVKLNKGKIQILSAEGFWEETSVGVQMSDLQCYFTGTIVNLEFNLADTSYYCLKTEIQDEEIRF